jgi:hypothetical protein
MALERCSAEKSELNRGQLLWQGSVFTSELVFEETLIQTIATLAARKHKKYGIFVSY